MDDLAISFPDRAASLTRERLGAAGAAAALAHLSVAFEDLLPAIDLRSVPHRRSDPLGAPGEAGRSGREEPGSGAGASESGRGGGARTLDSGGAEPGRASAAEPVHRGEPAEGEPADAPASADAHSPAAASDQGQDGSQSAGVTDLDGAAPALDGRLAWAPAGNGPASESGSAGSVSQAAAESSRRPSATPARQETTVAVQPSPPEGAKPSSTPAGSDSPSAVRISQDPQPLVSRASSTLVPAAVVAANAEPSATKGRTASATAAAGSPTARSAAIAGVQAVPAAAGDATAGQPQPGLVFAQAAQAGGTARTAGALGPAAAASQGAGSAAGPQAATAIPGGAAGAGPGRLAPTVPAKPAAAPTTRPVSVADQVSVHITRALKGGADRINIQLRPASLGRIEVRLDLGPDGRVHATLTADNRQTFELLRGDARMLERAFQDAGFKADSGSLSFNLRGYDDRPAGGDARGGHGLSDGAADRDAEADDEPVVEALAGGSSEVLPGRLNILA